MTDQPTPTDGAPPHAVPTHTVVIPSSVSMVSLLGPRDELLRTMERAFPKVEINVRGNEFRMVGAPDDVALIERTIDELLVVIEAGQPLNRDAVERSISMLRNRTAERPADVLTMNIVSNRGRTIRPKTLNQKRYVEAIDKHTVVFGIGPAGTGKTYLAMAKAVAALQAKQVNRIILTRPAVEAGERLGFLPGTLNDKIDPYLRPLYDALHDMVDPDSIPRLMAAGTIEVAPLAYMRGRAQPLDSQVLTPNGFRRFGDLRVGDLVVGSDGRPTPVLGVYPQGVKPVFRVTSEDGASTVCCGEHLWQVTTSTDRRAGTTRVVTTAEIAAALPHMEIGLPVVAPVEFPERDIPTDAYAVGSRLVGQRALGGSGLSGSGVGGAGVGGAGVGGSGVGGSGVGGHGGTLLADISRDYFHNSIAVRTALLQGLLDAAGEPVPAPDATLRVRYAAPNAQARDDVVFLVRSLGGLATVRDTGRADRHVVDLRLPPEIVPFRADGELSAYVPTRVRRPERRVASVVPVGEAETQCIQVGAADSLYVTDDFLVTHNTLNDAFIILDEAQNTSPEQMKMFLTRLGFGSKMVVTGDVTQVDLPGGTMSGLRVVQDILQGIEDVHFSMLTSIDVVRHRLVGEIVDAYGRWDERQPRPGSHDRRPRPVKAPSEAKTRSDVKAQADVNAPSGKER